MELLNIFLEEILSFVFYFQLLIGESLMANMLHYPLATFFVIILTLAVSIIAIIALMVLLVITIYKYINYYNLKEKKYSKL